MEGQVLDINFGNRMPSVGIKKINVGHSGESGKNERIKWLCFA